MPFRIKKVNGYFKLDFTQLVYKTFNYNQGNVTFSLYYKQLNINSSTQINWIENKDPYVTTDLSLSYRLSRGYNIRVSSQYNISGNNFLSYKAEFEKRFSKGYVSLSYERNILSNSNFFNLNLKYDLPFARTSFSSTYNNGRFVLSEGAQGSFAFGSGNQYIHVSNNSSVTKGGISLYPFLDLNANGIFDNGERMIKLTSVKVMGSNVIFSRRDSIIRIPDLIAFTNYTLEFSDNDLDNIAWRFKKKIYSVVIDPNQFKHIDIPIIAVGEVTGTAYLVKDHALKGIGRLVVKFYKKNSDVEVGQTLTENDGYIYYMGLAAGEYVARVDAGQLENLGFTSEPVQREFTVKTTTEGDMVDGIDFVLTKK